MKKLGIKDFKINSIHFPKSVKELVRQEARNFQTCTPLGIEPQSSVVGSPKTYFPRVPFKVKALVGGRYMALEGSFKIKEASKDGMLTETTVAFPDGSCVSMIDKTKTEGGHETNLPSIEADPTLINIWMNTAGKELKMACMSFLLKTDPKSLKL